MGLFDRMKASLSVIGDKASKEAGLEGFSNEVSLRESENNLAVVEKDLLAFKATVRTKQNQRSEIQKEVDELQTKLNSYVAFVKENSQNEAEATRVKNEAQKVFTRIEEKKVKIEALDAEISGYNTDIEKTEKELEKFRTSIREGRDSIKSNMAKQEIANSKIRLAESAEKLMGNQHDLSSGISARTKEREAEADVKFENLFGNNKEADESSSVDALIKSKEKDKAFESLFQK